MIELIVGFVDLDNLVMLLFSMILLMNFL